MYNVSRNNFYGNEKNATVYTPAEVSHFLFHILHDKISQNGYVLDPCVGQGALLKPFKKAGFNVMGIDIEDQGFPHTLCKNFISIRKGELKNPSLVMANPPFNIDKKTKEMVAASLGRRPLLPELWLQKIVQLFGKLVPIVLFAPYGLRLNQSLDSKRWMRFVNGTYPEIDSIVALPKDIYEHVLFHSEVLIFNVKGLRGHYFYHRSCVDTAAFV